LPLLHNLFFHTHKTIFTFEQVECSVRKQNFFVTNTNSKVVLKDISQSDQFFYGKYNRSKTQGVCIWQMLSGELVDTERRMDTSTK